MHVMLIEDDPLVREVVLDSLASEGMEVEGLASAEDALVLLGAGQVPDVLVADINLGQGLTGTQLAAIARERHPGVEVVIISADAAAAHGPLQRRERFLQKPFTTEALAAAIRAAASAATPPG